MKSPSLRQAISMLHTSLDKYFFRTPFASELQMLDKLDISIHMRLLVKGVLGQLSSNYNTK